MNTSGTVGCEIRAFAPDCDTFEVGCGSGEISRRSRCVRRSAPSFATLPAPRNTVSSPCSRWDVAKW